MALVVKSKRGDELRDLLVVDAVAVALPGADIVVIVEDEEGLGAVDLGFGLFEVGAEGCGVELVVIAMEAEEHVHRELQLVGSRSPPYHLSSSAVLGR